MSKYKSKKSKLSTALGVVAAILAIVLFGALIGLSAKSETKNISSTAFSVGGIDAEGNYEDVKTSIYTEKLFECQGLSVEPDFEATGTYQVFYYGADKNFMGATDVLNANEGVYTKGNTFTFAKYARIVITPDVPVDEEGNAEEDFKIRFYEAVSYADDYTIKVNKDQNFSVKNIIKGLDNKANILGEGIWQNDEDVFHAEASGMYFFNIVDTRNANTLIMKVATKTLTNTVSYGDGQTFNMPMLYDVNDSIVAEGNTGIGYFILESNNDFTYISYNVSAYSSVVGCVDVASVDVLEIYVQ